jgi:hypothetical protein
MRGLCAVFVIGLALALIGGPTFAQDSDAKPIELSKAERAEIENFLGEGVVGKAVSPTRPSSFPSSPAVGPFGSRAAKTRARPRSRASRQ